MVKRVSRDYHNLPILASNESAIQEISIWLWNVTSGRIVSRLSWVHFCVPDEIFSKTKCRVGCRFRDALDIAYQTWLVSMKRKLRFQVVAANSKTHRRTQHFYIWMIKTAFSDINSKTVTLRKIASHLSETSVTLNIFDQGVCKLSIL